MKHVYIYNKLISLLASDWVYNQFKTISSSKKYNKIKKKGIYIYWFK